MATGKRVYELSAGGVTRRIMIDPEFENLLVPLSSDEHDQLVRNLVAEGRCHDPLIVWKSQDGGILLDGHNRLVICDDRNIPYTVRSIELEDRDAATRWIVENQLGRRNLTDFARVELALKLDGMLSKIGKSRRAGKDIEGDDLPILNDLVDPEKPFDRAQVIADKADVGRGTVAKVKKILKDSDPETIRDVREGRKSIGAAFNEVKSKELDGNGSPSGFKEIREPGDESDDGEEVDEPILSPESEKVVIRDPNDDRWLDSLPARASLRGSIRRRFDADALLYREMEDSRTKFKNVAVRYLGKAKRTGGKGGAFAYLLERFLKIKHPRDWTACPDRDHDGCGGSGVIQGLGNCPKCHGRGYSIL